MRILFILLLSVFTFSAGAQNTDTVRKKNVIKISPLKMIDVSNSAVELTFERAMGNHFATGLTAGWLLPHNLGSGPVEPYPKARGFTVAVEQKYYLRESAPRGSYFAAELDFLLNRYHVREYFIDASAAEGLYYEENTYQDDIVIHKQTLTLSVKWGCQFLIGRFGLEVFGGVGIRYKDVYHSGRQNPLDAMFRPPHPNVFYE